MSAAATGGHGERIGARPRGLPARLLRLATDERLVELLRGGSEPAFEALYARYHRGVLSFCRHMLGSAEEAEDAVQHTFLSAYADLVGSTKEIRLRAWLYAIARNRCLTVLRVRRERVEEIGEPATDKLSAEVEHRWELRALLGDLAALPDDQRAALVLAELGDLSHDDIGAALGCPREKVKALVFQARRSLIASREARETSCAEIQEQLANLRGGALRRNLLRRHVRECDGCADFYDRVRAQRRELALILPVTPSLGLKAAILGGGGGAAAAGSIVAKTVIVLAVAGGGTAAVETVTEERERPRPAATAPEPPAAPAAAAGAVASAPVEAPPAAVSAPPRNDAPRETAPRRRAERPSPARADEAARVAPGGHAKAKKAKPEKPVPRGHAKVKPPKPVPPGHAKPKPSKGAGPPGHAKPKPPKPVPPGHAKPKGAGRPDHAKAKPPKPVPGPRTGVKPSKPVAPPVPAKAKAPPEVEAPPAGVEAPPAESEAPPAAVELPPGQAKKPK